MTIADERAVSFPPFDTPMLAWWRGVYDHAFIALHPFYALQSDMGRDALVDWKDRPRDFGHQIKRRGEAVSWGAVHQAVAPEVSREKVNLAIWLAACFGYAERAGVALQKRIVDWTEEQRLYFPDDDNLPPIMEPGIGRFLAALGATEVTAYDQFLEHGAVFPVTALAADQPHLRMPDFAASFAIRALHLQDPGVLFIWNFDCVEVVIALTDRALKAARPEDHFEGWYADATTYRDVFNPKDFVQRRG